LPRRPETSAWFACTALQRCLLLTRDAYDWLLPSTASISSTRASFALDEIASRAYGLFRFPPAPPALKGVASPSDERSSTQRFHDAVVAPLDRCFGVCFSLERRGVFFPCVRHRSNRCRACRAARDAPACESLRIGPHTRTAPRPPRSETREDFTAVRSDTTSIERCTSSTGALRHPPRLTWNLVPRRASSLGSGGFAATGPRAPPLHRDDAVLLCANTVASARPLFTPANRIDAGASLSQT